MSQPPISPPPIPHSPDPVGSSVRRSHTISSSSRRTGSRTTDHSEADEWNEHDTVGEDWVGGVGTIGEKNSSLHRQASLPSKYNRPIRPHDNRAGALTPVGGLSSHMDPGYDEGDWELEIRRTQEDANIAYQQSQQQQERDEEEENQESTPYGASSSTQAGVRRYHTVTYGQHAPKRPPPSLQRAGTTTTRRSQTTNIALDAAGDEDKFATTFAQNEVQEYDEPGSFHGHDEGQQIYGNTSAGNSWQGSNDSWRAGNPNEWRGGNQVEELSRAMGGMDLQQQGQPTQTNYAHGPRFTSNARQASPNFQQQQYMDGSHQQGRNLKVHTDVNQNVNHGPASAGAYVPPIGHGQGGQRPQERTVGGRSSNPNLSQAFNNPYGGNQTYNNVPPPPPIPAQYLNQVGGVQHSGRLNTGSAFAQQGNQGNGGVGGEANRHPAALQPGNPATYLSSPIDVPTMIAQKGYNPAGFDIKPPFARYFVIKSYTEDDVHKSLKYEIWSSTDPGNKRLDKAFKECAGRGPIYLFFSVNASGHFCGMAEMLTPVDYTRSSTVWASDKWKGVFKVRWIFVRDIPNAVLRNIRLNNTQERKPVTNSRDTQELLPEAGHEMLRIFFTHPARTSLLQDFAFYELQSMQKQQQQVQQQVQQPGSGTQSPQPGVAPSLQSQQHPYAMPNPHAVPYPNMMPPMMQNSGYAPAPGVVQGVMRGTSPAPPIAHNPGYGGSMGGNGNGNGF